MISHSFKRFSGAPVLKHSFLTLGAALMILGVSHSQGFDQISVKAASELQAQMFGEQAEASQREQYVELIGSIDNALSGLGNKARLLADDTLLYLESGKASDS
ncbi:hypothetical protein [Allohahella marinimesophila]|uniref:Methyl-accepting chemotaxis protein n=1 Tax=Allohahella marinimesophila TaxID=1054972 RepID=A0ABP7PRH1_9GAMM